MTGFSSSCFIDEALEAAVLDDLVNFAILKEQKQRYWADVFDPSAHRVLVGKELGSDEVMGLFRSCSSAFPNRV